MTNPAEYITGRTVQEQMNQLIGYVDTRAAEVATSAIASDVADVAQAKTDAESARDAAIAAKDTAVSTVSDCVKMTPSGVQTIGSYKLVVSQGVDANVTGDVTGDVTGNVTGDVTAGTITASGTATFSGTTKAPTPGQSAGSTEVATVGYVSNTGGNLNNLVHTNGAETVAGVKTLTSPPVVSGGKDNAYVQLKNSYLDNPNAANAEPMIKVTNSNGDIICGLFMRQNANGTHVLRVRIRNSDGTTYTEVDLATSS